MSISYLNIRTSKDGLAAYGLDFTQGAFFVLAANAPRIIPVPEGFSGYILIGPPSNANFLLSDEPIVTEEGISRAQQNPGLRWVDQSIQPNLYILSDAAATFTLSWYKHHLES
jgi:hypothetical protein